MLQTSAVRESFDGIEMMLCLQCGTRIQVGDFSRSWPVCKLCHLELKALLEHLNYAVQVFRVSDAVAVQLSITLTGLCLDPFLNGFNFLAPLS